MSSIPAQLCWSGLFLQPRAPQCWAQPGQREEAALQERMEMGCDSLAWGGRGEELAWPHGAARMCRATLPAAGEGSVPLLQDILLVRRRVEGLGGTLQAPGLLATGDMGEEEEVLGVVSSAAQPDVLVMYMHNDAVPWGGLQDESDSLGSPSSLCRASESRKPFLSPGLTLYHCGHMEESTPLSHRGEIELSLLVLSCQAVTVLGTVFPPGSGPPPLPSDAPLFPPQPS